MVITSQSEWDALPKEFGEFTVIEIRSAEKITIRSIPRNGRAVLRGSSSAVLRESSSAVLWESSRAELRESSRAELWESSRAVLRGSSSAVLRESSRAVLWESSRAELWESSRAELWGQTTAHQRSRKSPELHGQAVCFMYDGYAVPLRKSDGATIIQVVPVSGTLGWLKENGVLESDGKVTLYKRVSKDLLTQEGTERETAWAVGSRNIHPAWCPTISECGGGKYHACSRPYFGDEFRSENGDRYIAIEIAVTDLYAWPEAEHPRKIAFREGLVLYECDRWGEKISGTNNAESSEEPREVACS